MSLMRNGPLVVWEPESGTRLVDADDATMTFEPTTGRLTASGPGFEIAGNIQRSPSGFDRLDSPAFLSCKLDDGTHTQWTLYQMTDSERAEVLAAYRQWMS
jgi:hypothetical protein